MRTLRIVFMGTPDFAVESLKLLNELNFNIVGVITAPDKPSGRGRKLQVSAVKKYALDAGLKVLQPYNLKNESFLAELKGLNANLQIVVAFRMLPEAVWRMPKYGTFNLHASLLPQYRGAAPINHVLINGETETGVTTFFIDEKIDTGAIILKDKMVISSTETASSLHDKLMVLGGQLVIKTTRLIEINSASTKLQPEVEDLKKAPKLFKENCRIDWTLTGVEIYNFVRGLNTKPGAWSCLKEHKEDGGIEIKIYQVAIFNEKHALKAGSISLDKKQLRVATADGFVLIMELQMPGRKKMKIADLLNGYRFSSAVFFE